MKDKIGKKVAHLDPLTVSVEKAEETSQCPVEI